MKLFNFILINLVSYCINELDINNNESEWTTKQFNFDHDGIVRSYILHKPNNLKDNAPLLFVLHGYGSKAYVIMDYSQMNSIGDKNGYMIC